MRARVAAPRADFQGEAQPTPNTVNIPVRIEKKMFNEVLWN
jgi:hypothetical protein